MVSEGVEGTGGRRRACASKNFLLGDFEASTTRFPLSLFNAGRSNGGGGSGGPRLGAVGDLKGSGGAGRFMVGVGVIVCSYEGGGSEGG